MTIGTTALMAATGAAHPEALRQTLLRWTEAGWLRPLDLAFGEFLWREAPEASPWLILAATLASHQLGRGHACLDLAITLDDPAFALSLPPEGVWPQEDGGLEPPPLPGTVMAGLTLADWLAALDHPELIGTGPGATPLVRAGARLYLRRYWQYEQSVREGIERRLREGESRTRDLPVAEFKRTLEALFPSASPVDGAIPLDWQKIACALTARGAFGIITGGPGTGKTTTVVRLLALLQSLALAGTARPLRIRLAAPTGKAAARLNQSIAKAIDRLSLDRLEHSDALHAAIPHQVTTLHRLLGSRPDTRQFRHTARHPLALDVLVIDEASMIDLELMAAVLDALPERARLILLGDKDQLASVEAGAVLGNLCQRAETGGYTDATRDWLREVTGEDLPAEWLAAAGRPLDQAVVMLRQSHRFSADSGIGVLAQAVNAGDTRRVAALWRKGCPDIARLAPAPADDAPLRGLALGQSGQAESPLTTGYSHYLRYLDARRPMPDAGRSDFDEWALGVLLAHARFQVLCAVRRGPWGVEGLNRTIARWLHEAGLIARTDGWYEGRPVLVTRNDYGLGLMNGDIGITLRLPGVRDGSECLRVAFPAATGAGIHWVLPSRLQAVETVYALTVHKSQGSEFTHAALVLPDRPNPILTRELLYTGITRASQAFTLVTPGPRDVLESAISRRVLRHGGTLTGTDN
ncbi:MAG: exodeoxyribonuclease V subunit alpha [Methylococcus sp.]